MLLSAPVDEARVLAEATKQPMRYAWDEAVALFRPDLHDRSAWAAYWYLRNQWPFKANGDASVEEARLRWPRAAANGRGTRRQRVGAGPLNLLSDAGAPDARAAQRACRGRGERR